MKRGLEGCGGGGGGGGGTWGVPCADSISIVAGQR